MGHFKIIGILESCFREKFGTPRQAMLAKSATARLRVRREFTPEHSLRGLEGFSHVWLISLFHLNANKAFRPIVHPPRLKGRTMGVFATRSPHRANPLALTLARLEGVEKDTLLLSGIDLVDGTPVLDIKPYLPDGDRAPGASKGWAGSRPFPRLRVAFAPPARRQIRVFGKTRPKLGKLLREVLSHDPRNHRDRTQSRDGKVLGFFLFDLNILFSVRKGKATVLALETGRVFAKENRGLRPGSTRRVPKIRLA